MSRLFSTLIFCSLSFNGIISSANIGPGISGGGDECENRFKIIAQDLHSWINDGGAEGLSLPTGLTADSYADAMLNEITKAKISCVGHGDKGYPVMIKGTPKTCRFDKTEESSRITCDYEKFRALSEEEQYVLVHHEYAGLSGIETANGDDSQYEISNQITAYLEDTIVKKLVVKPGVDEMALCEEDIRTFVATSFPFDDSAGERQYLSSVIVDKVLFIDSTGSVDIEAHALFDEYGYNARRIFISADGVWTVDEDGVGVPSRCENFLVKASFPNPLAD